MKFRDYAKKSSRISKIARNNTLTILSAYKEECSEKENRERHSQLLKDVENMCTEMRGTYEYDGNKEIEHYVVLIDADENVVKDLLSKYGQQSYVFVNERKYSIRDTLNETKFIGSLKDVMQRFHIKDKEAFDRYTSYMLECERKYQNHIDTYSRYSDVNKWVLEAKESRDLNEASLSRIKRHIDKLDSWSIQTAYRGNKTIKENKEAMKRFEQQLKSKGYGFIKLQGVGQEEDPKTGEIEQAKEISLFIMGISYEDASKFAKMYEQTGFVYSGPETDGKIILYFQSGEGWKIDSVMNRFKAGRVAQFYSKIKGRPFVFESIISKSWIEGLARSIRRKGVR